MKIRSGFVSNSSSSSFIIVFPKEINSVDEMGELLYRGEWDEPQEEHEDSDICRKTIAETVYRDYVEAKKAPREEQDREILSDLGNKHYIHAWSRENLMEIMVRSNPDSVLLDLATKRLEISERLRDMGNNDRKTNAHKKLVADDQAIMEQENERMSILAQDEYNKLLKIHKKYIILRLEYSDNDGNLGSTIEHGNVFKNLIYQSISHH